MPFEIGYTDNLSIASPDLQLHEQHVRAVLKRLDENEMHTHQSNSVVGVQTPAFLEQTIRPEGVAAVKEEVDTIK